MPPKKEEEVNKTEYKPCFILPIFVNGSHSAASKALGKPVSVKKNIDKAKIIQILKDKGLQQHIINGQINEAGKLFVCQNIKIVSDEFITSLSKPADPKKDVKKDTKKDTKKEEPVVEAVVPPLQIDFPRNCNDFYVYLGIPANEQQLLVGLSKQMRLDIAVVVEQKIKPGSRKPNYDLLNNEKSLENISQMMKETKIDPLSNKSDDQQKLLQNKKNSTLIVKAIKRYLGTLPKDHPSKNMVILKVTYYDDLSQPAENDTKFLKSFFETVCKCNKQLEEYNEWRKSRKLVPMIEPIKQTISKQVQVQDKTDKNKKGGKSAQPVFETVQEVIERRYEQQPENIKSDLKQYSRIKQVKRQLNSKLKNGSQFGFQDILSTCLQSFKSVTNTKLPIYNKNIYLGAKVQSNHQIKPLNIMTQACVAHTRRQIGYYKELQMKHQCHFNFQSIPSNFSLIQLSQKSETPIDQLKMQYMIYKFQQLAKSQSSKIKWNFRDRDNLQYFTKEQMVCIINDQLLHDPEVFTGKLNTEDLKLIIMSRTNPPGRVLYHNSIFEWKVLPNFQNWLDFFAGKSQKLKTEEFWDFPQDQTGNLQIKSKNMMPTDNTIIRDESYTIGGKVQNTIQLCKQQCRFGIAKNNVYGFHDVKYTYWHQIDEKSRLRIYKSNNKGQGSEAQSLAILLQKKNQYRMLMDPSPVLTWQNPTYEKSRAISNNGDITSYRLDGSIHIYSSTGQISIFRNGKWTRSQNTYISELVEGQYNIKIRKDQTLIIQNHECTKIIFPDTTEILRTTKPNKIQIKNPRGPYIRTYLPRTHNFNAIGYGSAFAYLGFNNILERSYDGFLQQIVDNGLSFHSYVQKFDKNNHIVSENIVVIATEDSSLFKINKNQGTIAYNSATPNQVLNQQSLNERWLQLFTTPANHGEGLFYVDLNCGFITNKDAETNRFVAKSTNIFYVVGQKSETYIAVSFVREGGEDEQNNFGNGFHIKQENYFLPPPVNQIPARIFSINHDGSGIEYLNSRQLSNMKKYTVVNQQKTNKYITHFSQELHNQQQYLNVTFSHPVFLTLFGLPDALRTPETKESLIPVKFNALKHRVIETVNWNSDYSNICLLEEQLKKEKQSKICERKGRKLQKKSRKQSVTIEG